ncbi:MAG TPA: DUF3352 domain-containing protein [Pyrinomonadaceae bacterium]|nr:DUF3352 domain-containing protein [Pyrinomonadaceae bacterium]
MRFRQNLALTTLLTIAVVSAASPLGYAQKSARRRSTTSRQTVSPAKKSTTNTAASPAASAAKHAPRDADARAEVEQNFDELVAGDSFAVYSEVRSLSQFVRSEDMTELLGALGKIAGGVPAEANQFLQFVGENSEALSDATVIFAAMPARPELPNALTALRLPTIEEARRFEPRLKKYLSTLPEWMTGQTPPAGAANSVKRSSKRGAKRASAPQRFVLKQHGNLLFASEKPFALGSLKPDDATPLAKDTHFQQARARLASEQFFFYVNIGLLSQSTRILGERHEAQMQTSREASRDSQETIVMPGAGVVVSPTAGEIRETVDSEVTLSSPRDRVIERTRAEMADAEKRARLEADAELEALKDEESDSAQPGENGAAEGGVMKAEADSLGMIWPGIFGRMFGGASQWPEAVGVGLALNGRDLLLRTLVIDEAGKPSPLIPFFPVLTRGPATVSEAAGVAPADTELFVALSLDVPRMYEEVVERVSETQNLMVQEKTRGQATIANDKTPTMRARIAAAEEKYKFRMKEDFLATLGNEVALSTSLSYLGISTFGRNRAADEKAAPDFVALVALKDKEAFKTMLPKVAEAMGMKLLFDLAKTENQNDIEIVTIAAFAYAYVNNFLVFSTSPAAVRRVVENYSNGKTLAAGEGFRDPTAWQPREKVAQVFVASSMMKSLIAGAKKQLAQGDAEEKNISATLAFDPAAITYAVSDDGTGLMHELRLPKNLLKLMAVMAAAEMKQAPIKGKESMAMYSLTRIFAAQEEYKKVRGKGGYAATLEGLRMEKFGEELGRNQDYKFEMSASGGKLEITATPIQYGTSGKRSFFIDESGTLRGADHAGQRATVADEEVN